MCKSEVFTVNKEVTIMSNQNQPKPLVYFFAKSTFGDEQPDYVKIGYTKTELSLRKAALQTGSESPIWAIGVLPFDTEDAARSEEKRLHEQFGGFRSRGEWFYATPRIIKHIENYAIQYTERFIENVPPTSDIEIVESEAPPTRSEEAIAFGNWLRNCMTERQIDDDALTKIVGCTAGYIRYLKNGCGMPGSSLREALIVLFGDPTDSTIEAKFNNPLFIMLDGNPISKDTAIDTFIEVIKELGIEKVKKLDLHINGIPLIANCDHEDKAQRKVETETGTYYIVSGTNTMKKASILDDIAKGLNVDMTVLTNPRA